MSGEVCGDNRFEIIEKAKQDLLDSTNINTSPSEMAVLDNILFRCWQMGWLDKYDDPKEKIICVVNRDTQELNKHLENGWIIKEISACGNQCLHCCYIHLIKK